jgi:hypothetical protein
MERYYLIVQNIMKCPRSTQLRVCVRACRSLLKTFHITAGHKNISQDLYTGLGYDTRKTECYTALVNDKTQTKVRAVAFWDIVMT